MKRIFFAIIVAAFGVTVGCGSKESKEARKDEDSVKERQELVADTMAEYAAWEADMDRRLNYNDSLAAAYRTEAMKDKKNWAAHEKRVKELEEKNKALRQRKADYKEKKTNTKWQTFKDEFNRDMDNLGNSFNDLGKDNVKDRENIKDGKKATPQEKP